ncbi:PTS sugar transporter subunit IIA [Ligilactobacillus apodemi]|nr:PTS sugar transporter subunit IIA [Ligilactobacillus apodemi]
MSVDYQSMLHPELIFLDLTDQNEAELFEQVAQRLEKLGYVQNTYADALKKREQEFPTGLVTKYLALALPHTDPEYVDKAFICMVKNATALDVLQMGLNEPMQTQYFFFLGITATKNQVILLQKFMQLLQRKAFVKGVTTISKADEMFEFLQQEFGK